MTDAQTLCRSTGPETSLEAAEAIAPQISVIQALVLDEFKRAGPAGLTDRELTQLFTRYGGSTYRTRRSELTDRGLIVDSGRRRLYETPRRHIVWVLGEYKR